MLNRKLEKLALYRHNYGITREELAKWFQFYEYTCPFPLHTFTLRASIRRPFLKCDICQHPMIEKFIKLDTPA